MPNVEGLYSVLNVNACTGLAVYEAKRNPLFSCDTKQEYALIPMEHDAETPNYHHYRI